MWRGLKGYTSFYPNPGEFESMVCKVCGGECSVERKVFGKTSMFGNPREHDEFYCPNAKEEWHGKALNLLMESENTASDSLREIILGDMKKVLEER